MGKPPEPPKPNLVVLYEMIGGALSGIARFMRHVHGQRGKFSDYNDGDFYVSPDLLSSPEDAMVVRKKMRKKARAQPRAMMVDGLLSSALAGWDNSTGGAISAAGFRGTAEYFDALSRYASISRGKVGGSCAESLVGSLEWHLGMEFPQNARDKFVDAVSGANAPIGSEFCSRLPLAEHNFSDAGFYYGITLRRVVNNRCAGRHSKSAALAPVLQIARLASWLGIRSSDLLLADLVRNRDVGNMLAECKFPYSLVAKVSMYEVTDCSASALRKHVIAIPGYERNETVLKWENRNAKEAKCIKDSYLFSI